MATSSVKEVDNRIIAAFWRLTFKCNVSISNRGKRNSNYMPTHIYVHSHTNKYSCTHACMSVYVYVYYTCVFKFEVFASNAHLKLSACCKEVEEDKNK